MIKFLFQLIKPPVPKVGDTYCLKENYSDNPFNKPMLWTVKRVKGKYLELQVGGLGENHATTIRDLVISFKPWKSK